MTKRDILLRPSADEDLESIYDYSFEKFGLNRAIEYIHDLNSTFIKLANNPDLARKCDFIKPNLQTYQVYLNRIQIIAQSILLLFQIKAHLRAMREHTISM